MDLGAEGRTTNCRYHVKDTYTLTATATAANGWSTTATNRVFVRPDPLTLTLKYREVGNDGMTIEVRFDVEGAPDRSVCEWEFGDGHKKKGVCGDNWVYEIADLPSDNTVTVRVLVHPSTGADDATLEIKIKFSV